MLDTLSDILIMVEKYGIKPKQFLNEVSPQRDHFKPIKRLSTLGSFFGLLLYISCI